MARKSMQQLEEEANSRKTQELNKEGIVSNSNVERQLLSEATKHFSSNERIIGELLQTNQPTTRYKVPEQVNNEKSTIVPKINPSDYPEINVRGSFPVERQKRGANLLILKEIDNILSIIDVGNNRNATLNFLLWVGLQTIKGMPDRIDVRVHENTFADGGGITNFEK